MQRTLSVVLVLALAAVLGSGCRRESRPAPQQEPTASVEPTRPPEPALTRVLVYFARGEKIGAAARLVPASSDTEVLARAAVEELVKGPTPEEREFGLGTLIPERTTVRGVSIDGPVATVNLSPEFESGGGSLSMLLRVAQVVCTLTQFDGVERVAFEIGGVPAKAIGGEGVIVDPPVSRADFEDQLPPILVESPAPGETIKSPVTVTGSSNVFEAVHQVALTDPEGEIIAERTVTASAGTGTRGTWSVTIPFGPIERDGLGAVVVWALSPKDGSRYGIVEIPVRMKR